MDEDSTRLWQMRREHVDLDFLRALAKQELLEGKLICNLKFGEHCVLDKKTKVKFDTITHHSEGLLDCIHIDFWDPTKTASLGDHKFFIFFC